VQKLDVGIIGYGIAGLAVAIRLRCLGHRITHFERANPPARFGAGMLLHPRGQRELARLGVLAEVQACASKVERVCAQTVQGRSLVDWRYSDLGRGQSGLGVSRAALHAVLARADAGREGVQAGCEITAIDAMQGVATDSTGTQHGPFDLLVVADGAHSKLRAQFQSFAVGDVLSDCAALVGLAEDPQGLAGAALVQYFDGPRHLSVWPAGCEAAGDVLSCAFAMNARLAEANELRDRGRWLDRVRHLCPWLGRLLQERPSLATPFVYSYRDVEVERCMAGRSVLVGDAGHSMSPQLGAGVQLALEDAAALADSLSGNADMSGALVEYASRRLPAWRRYHHASRVLTPMFQSDSRSLAAVRDALLPTAMRVPGVRQFAQELLG